MKYLGHFLSKDGINKGDQVDAIAQLPSPTNAPAKATIHPWIPPGKPWIRVHVDHTIDFLGSNWLVMIATFSKYPCLSFKIAVTSL